MSEVVTFNGNDLSAVNGLTIIGTDPHRPPERSLNSSEIARADRSAVAAAFYKSRKVHVLAALAASNKASFQTALRSLESLLQATEAALVFSIGGVQTQFTATKSNITLSNEAGGFAELDIEFFCSDPIGVAVSATTLYSYAHLVGGAYSFAISWSGNVRQQPVVTVTVNTLTGTSNTITIANPTTGESVAVTRTWSAADVLVVNSKTKSVTVNGSAVAYSGTIPETGGTEALTYADNFTARNIALDITYQVRNL